MENVLVEISDPIQDSRQQHSSAEGISQAVAQLGQAPLIQVAEVMRAFHFRAVVSYFSLASLSNSAGPREAGDRRS